MHDPRVDQLARQLVRYSTQVKKGDMVWIDCFDVPAYVAQALIRADPDRAGLGDEHTTHDITGQPAVTPVSFPGVPVVFSQSIGGGQPNRPRARGGGSAFEIEVEDGAIGETGVIDERKHFPRLVETFDRGSARVRGRRGGRGDGEWKDQEAPETPDHSVEWVRGTVPHIQLEPMKTNWSALGTEFTR